MLINFLNITYFSKLHVTNPLKGASLVAEMVKNLPANAGDPGSIPG